MTNRNILMRDTRIALSIAQHAYTCIENRTNKKLQKAIREEMLEKTTNFVNVLRSEGIDKVVTMFSLLSMYHAIAICRELLDEWKKLDLQKEDMSFVEGLRFVVDFQDSVLMKEVGLERIEPDALNIQSAVIFNFNNPADCFGKTIAFLRKLRKKYQPTDTNSAM